MRVAMIQSQRTKDTIEGNIARLVDLARSTKQLQPDMVVLSELCCCGLDMSLAERLAQRRDGPYITALSMLAREMSAYVVGGTFWELADDGVYNACPVLGPDGSLMAMYRKIHLFGPMGEPEAVKPGRDVVAFLTSWGKVGLAVCYDVRFPGLFAKLARLGVQTVVIPAAFPADRIGHWDVLLRARAIDNRLFVVGVNGVGREGRYVLGGWSQAVSPTGEVIAKCGQQEGELVADLDVELVAASRSAFCPLADRRPDLY